MAIKDLDFRQLLKQVLLIRIDKVKYLFSNLKGYKTAEAALICGSFDKDVGLFFVVVSLLEEKGGTYYRIRQPEGSDPVLLLPEDIAHLEAYDPGVDAESFPELAPFLKLDITEDAISAMYRIELDGCRLKDHPDIVKVVYMDSGRHFRNALVRVTGCHKYRFYGVEVFMDGNAFIDGMPMKFEVVEKRDRGWVCVNGENYPTEFDEFDFVTGRALDFALRRDYFEESVSSREFAVKIIKKSDLYINEEDDEPVVVETAQGKAYEFFTDEGDDISALPYTIEELFDYAERDGVTCLIADSSRFDMIYSLDEFH